MPKRGCILKTIKSSAYLVSRGKSKDVKAHSESVMKGNEQEEEGK